MLIFRSYKRDSKRKKRRGRGNEGENRKEEVGARSMIGSRGWRERREGKGCVRSEVEGGGRKGGG